MKNKKGGLLGDHTVNIIVGVICILLLAALLFKIGNFINDKNSLEQAQNSLDEIRKEMDAAKRVGKSEVFVLQPRDWTLAAFPSGQDARRPEKCTSLYCLCFCEPTKLTASCSLGDKHICLNENDQIITINEIKVDKPPVLLKISYSKGEIGVYSIDG